MQPAMPRRRHAGGFCVAIVDHPAPFETERGVNLAAATAIIPIAKFVFADELAIHPGPELGPECLRIPPGEEFEQEIFHCRQQTRLERGPFATSARPSPAHQICPQPLFPSFPAMLVKAAWTRSDWP